MSRKTKQVLFIVAAVALVIVLIGFLPNMIFFGLGTLLTLWAGTKFMGASQVIHKIGYGVLAVIGMATVLTNIWALVGVFVAWLLFKGYMMYQQPGDVEIYNADGTRVKSSSFQAFEGMWDAWKSRR